MDSVCTVAMEFKAVGDPAGQSVVVRKFPEARSAPAPGQGKKDNEHGQSDPMRHVHECRLPRGRPEHGMLCISGCERSWST